jgi:protein-S-isoprenylcysteine O-methyltransferase Ste14
VGLLLLAEAALHWGFPLAVWLPRPRSYCGLLVVLAGLALVGSAFRLFRRAKTGVVPFSDATALVSGGPYRFTRNPMYLGMTLVLLGVALLLGSVTPLLAPVFFPIVITYRFILPEEEFLEAKLGAPYLALKGRVRRWL